MKYTVKVYVASRVSLSEARVELENTLEASSPIEALTKTAQTSNNPLLRMITHNGDPEQVRRVVEDVIVDTPEGVAAEYDGEIIFAVFPTATGERPLWTKLKAWEAQFER